MIILQLDDLSELPRKVAIRCTCLRAAASSNRQKLARPEWAPHSKGSWLASRAQHSKVDMAYLAKTAMASINWLVGPSLNNSGPVVNGLLVRALKTP